MLSIRTWPVLCLLLGISPLATAHSITNSSTTNPASLTATLDVPCAKAIESLEKDFSRLLGKIPYVRDARHMHSGEWKDSDKYDKYAIVTKQNYFSFNPTMSKEFPTTFMPADVWKRACKRGADGDALEPTCKDMTNYVFTGKKAIIYQKTVEASRSQNWLQSFDFRIAFTELTANSCQYESTLYITNNTYLWAKKHLIGDTDPNLIEGKILSRFVDWSKETLPTLEGK